jgi:hypothetical protein
MVSLLNINARVGLEIFHYITQSSLLLEKQLHSYMPCATQMHVYVSKE